LPLAKRSAAGWINLTAQPVAGLDGSANMPSEIRADPEMPSQKRSEAGPGPISPPRLTPRP